MKSPFPGMDPYLEPHWGDVHLSLIQYTRDTLQPCLPDDLLARIEQRVFMESDERRVRYHKTDYRAALEPPLPAEDAAWAAALLKAANKC